MKIEVDFHEGLMTLTFEQINKLVEDAFRLGKEDGIKQANNVSRPIITKRPDRKPTLPQNNKVMLDKLLGKDLEQQQMVANMKHQEGYRKGFNDGVKAARENKETKFDPLLHVDNSLYGYAAKDELSGLNTPKGHMTILRNKNDWAKDVETILMKLTPYNEQST